MPISRLEDLALSSYLTFLEENCVVYVDLINVGEPIINGVAERIFSYLRKHLSKTVKGTHSLRELMIQRILGGDFPTPRFRKRLSKKPLFSNPTLDPTEETMQENALKFREMRRDCRMCMSPCCTHYGLLETMVCVVMNPDLRRVVVPREIADTLRVRNGACFGNFPALDPVSLVARYHLLVRNLDHVPLQKLHVLVSGYDLRMKPQLLAAFKEFQPYLAFSRYISGRMSLLPFANHMTLALDRLFSRGDSVFRNLLEIRVNCLYLAHRTADGEGEEEGKRTDLPPHVSLMRNLGRSCPNLAVLDFDDTAVFNANALLHLLFRDPFRSLHASLLGAGDDLHGIQDAEIANPDERYSPYDEDPWQRRPLSLERIDLIFVQDDRLVSHVETALADQEKERLDLLQGCVRSTDLVRALDEPMVRRLERPPGPKPWEDKGFDFEGLSELPAVALQNVMFRKVALDDSMYIPRRCSYTLAPREEPVLFPLASTLQSLRLGMDDHPTIEMVPFLLAAMPKLKSLGSADVIAGLRMMESLGAEEHFPASPFITELEEIRLERKDDPYLEHHLDQEWALSKSQAAKDVLKVYAAQVQKELTFSSIREDFALLVKYCPKIKHLRFILGAELGQQQQQQLGGQQIFEDVVGLTHLEKLSVLAMHWGNVSHLVRIAAPRLKSLKLTLHVDNDRPDTDLPLDELLDLCPNLEELNLKFPAEVSPHLSDHRHHHAPALDKLSYPNLTKLRLRGADCQDVLEFVWTKCPNLRTLSLQCSDQFVLTDDLVNGLLRSSRSSCRKSLRVLNLGEVSGESGVFQTLISALPSLREFRTAVVVPGQFPDDLEAEENREAVLSRVWSLVEWKRFVEDQKLNRELVCHWTLWRGEKLEKALRMAQKVNAEIDLDVYLSPPGDHEDAVC